MLLNLPSIKVVKTEENEHDYYVYAVPESEPSACSNCAGSSFYGHGTKTRLFMDTPIHGKRVGILLERKRYQCRGCQKTFFQPCRDVSDDHRATKRLIKYIEQRAMIRTCTSVAEDVGVTEGTVRNILNAHIEQLEKQYQFETPRILGIDEVHLNRTMRLVLTNIAEKTIVDMIDNRNKPTVIKALYRFNKPEKIKIVTMDMWRPYRDAVSSVIPQAIVVIDKFHIVKMANEAVEKGRKDLRDQMTKDEVKLLKKDRYLMLRRRRDLDATQEFLLSGWTENYPDLAELYHAKERFFDIWDSDVSRTEAESAYTLWKGSVPPGIRKYFSDLTRAIDNWHLEAFNYFDHRVTNAFTESINNQIKAIMRQGSGYSFDVLRARVLFSSGAHKIRRTPFKSNIPENALGYVRLADIGQEINYGVKILHDDSNGNDQ
jgi:transposase